MYYDSEVFSSLSLALYHQKSPMLLIILKKQQNAGFFFEPLHLILHVTFLGRFFFFAFEIGILMTNMVHLPQALQKETECLGFRRRKIHTYGPIQTHCGQTEEK